MSSTRLPQVTYSLHTADGPSTDECRVYQFRMSEAISEPYRVVIELATENLDLEFEALLGASCELEVRREEHVRAIMGIVTDIEWLGISSGAYLQLRLELQPAFGVLDQRVDSRLWQDKTALEIIDEVLGAALSDYGRSHDLGGVGRGQTPREYCVQYRESDFAFVSRLLEEEGISYCFIHDVEQGHEVLTLFEIGDQLDVVHNIDDSTLFPIVATNPDEISVESVQGIEWRRRLTATAVLRRDFDWMTPTELLSGDAGDADERGRKRRVYTHGRRRFETDDLAMRAADTRASHMLAGVAGHGQSNAVAFHAGRRVSVDGHAVAELCEDLILVRVHHQGDDPSALPATMSDGELLGGYDNTFECVPAAVELRPSAWTPKPRVHGPQTAIVCGAAGEEIDVDEHGRIRVQFHWQEHPSYDESASCWVRVAQSWAGPNWGAQFIPRIGMEVVVEFLEGNPDRPLVTGCVYNGDNAPPFELPGDKTQSGIRTNSSPGGGGSNELRFEDAAGTEEIYLHGQKDWTIVIENDKSQTVGHDESLGVGNDRSKQVGHDESISIGNDQTISVGHDENENVANNLTLTVGNDQALTVGNNQTITIACNRTETIGQNASETVALTKAITVGAAMQLSVGGALNMTVGGAAAEEVGGLKAVTVGLNHSEEVGGSRSIEVGKDLVVQAGSKGTLKTGAALGIMSADTLSMNADKDMTMGTGAKGMVEAKDKLTLKCGKAQIVLASNGDITLTGAKLTLEGSGNVKIKGSKIKLN